MLGLIYIFVVAKPISIRRLSLLFAVTLVAARCFYAVMHVKNSQSAALATAAALTIFAWLAPLLRAVGSSVKAQRLNLDALDSASGVVRITYASALAALLFVAFGRIVNAMHPLTFGILLPTLVAGALIGLALLTTSRSVNMRLSGFRDPQKRRATKF